MARAVGVVGLGTMGLAFAGHLVEQDLDVVGFDVDARRRDALADLGGTPASSAGAVGDNAELVVASLPDGHALLDTATALAACATVPMIAETSTLAPAVKERARQLVADGGGVLLDCPVSGTGSQARAGDVVVYASGDRAGYERIAPVLAAFARSSRYVGEFGTGTKLKLVANLLVAVHNVAAAEALVVAEHAGLDLDAALRELTDGAGTSRMLEVRGPVMAARSWHQPAATLSLYRKDLDLIRAFAGELGCQVPLLDAAADVYAAALAGGHEDDDAAAVFAVLADAAAQA